MKSVSQTYTYHTYHTYMYDGIWYVYMYAYMEYVYMYIWNLKNYTNELIYKQK